MQNGVIICTHTHTSTPDRSAMTDVGPVHSSVKFRYAAADISSRVKVRAFAAYLRLLRAQCWKLAINCKTGGRWRCPKERVVLRTSIVLLPPPWKTPSVAYIYMRMRTCVGISDPGSERRPPVARPARADRMRGTCV